MKNWLRRFFAGMGIGAGAAIPGVSGAAIAVIFHVYEDVISAVNNFRKQFKEAIRVLIPILIGVIAAVIPCIILFHLAFEYCMFALVCIFIGFLVGSFPGITNEVKGVKMQKKHVSAVILGIIFVVGLGIASVILGDKIDLQSTFDSMPWWLYLVLIPVGAVAAVALTVPGLSGSLILLILGFYRPLVDHTTGWAKEILHGETSHILPLLGMLGCFAIGCLIGVVLVSKIMTRLLAKHHDITFFAIIGFILGSVGVLFFNYDIVNYYKAWMGMSLPASVEISPIMPWYVELILGFVLIAACAFASYKLVKAESKEKEK